MFINKIVERLLGLFLYKKKFTRIFIHSINENKYKHTRMWKLLHHLSRCVVVSSSIWSGVWRLTVVGWSPMIVRFFPLLFSLLTGNAHHCPFCFLLFNSSPHSINFLSRSFFFYKSFYSFEFSSSIVISHMFDFLFWFLFLKNFNFILGIFVEVFFFFQFHPSINFFCFIFFQFDPYSFDFFPFIKAIF